MARRDAAAVVGVISAADRLPTGITTLNYLNRQGLRTRRGAFFEAMTVKRLALRLGIAFTKDR